MRSLSLYWKIFIAFWLTTLLIILTTAWVTSEITQKSSIPAHEKVFMDSYANAAVAIYESGHYQALEKWLTNMGSTKKMTLYLLCSTGKIIGGSYPPRPIKHIAEGLKKNELDDGLLKVGNIIVSHELLSTSGRAYRLAAVSAKPLSNFVVIPWAELTLRLTIAGLISGIICYLLSLYLTQPLRSLRLAAKSIAKGKFNTRVGHFKGHTRDEIDELSGEFDRMAEQLETLINSKARLLQDISHELRSPLARLQVALELARQKAPDSTTLEFYRMEMECVRLNNLIKEILEFARTDKPFDELNKTPTNLVHLLTRIIADANFEFSESKVRAILGKKQPCELLIDECLIHRAIENIIRNALHYSPANKTVLVLMTITANNLLIDILDEGPGVPEDQLETIFNPFYRVDKSREKKTGGYGLGLSIAQKAIKLHHGSIMARNRKRGGLRVRIALPLPEPRL